MGIERSGTSAGHGLAPDCQRAAVFGIVILGAVALVVASVTDADSVRVACATVASTGVGGLCGFLTAHKQGDKP